MKLGQRIKEARKAAGLSLTELKEKTGIGDSSLSEFENDKREPSVSQLAKIGTACFRSLDYFFTERPAPADFVLWRQRPSENAEGIERQFVDLCSKYRQLELHCDDVVDPILPTVTSDASRFTYDVAEELARHVRQELNLGNRPAFALLQALEEECGIKVFFRRFEPAGTAACTKSELYGCAVLLNGCNSRARRNYDLAHELFHLVTWNVFRSSGNSIANEQEEKYANKFASVLLMPEEQVRSCATKLFRGGKLDLADIPELARQFDVSPEAMLWRLHWVYRLANDQSDRTKELAEKLGEIKSAANGCDDPAPDALPERYRALAIKALRHGQISIGRFADVMEISKWEAKKLAEQEVLPNGEVQLAPA